MSTVFVSDDISCTDHPMEKITEGDFTNISKAKTMAHENVCSMSHVCSLGSGYPDL